MLTGTAVHVQQPCYRLAAFAPCLTNHVCPTTTRRDLPALKQECQSVLQCKQVGQRLPAAVPHAALSRPASSHHHMAVLCCCPRHIKTCPCVSHACRSLLTAHAGCWTPTPASCSSCVTGQGSRRLMTRGCMRPTARRSRSGRGRCCSDTQVRAGVHVCGEPCLVVLQCGAGRESA